MKRYAIAACAAGTVLVATSPSASAAGWEPSDGSVTVDAVNPCTGEVTDFTLSSSESMTKVTKSGTVRSSSTGTYTATDGSSGTVRITSSSSLTKDGYADSYRRVLVGEYDGQPQRLTFVFRIVVGEDSDVKVMLTESSCGG
ncbi:MAG TPA: hypothetical protein VFI44_13485 [Ornithinibacter sp.]|nr:hypothetical protein [Ornithinibacter sp.]